MTNQPLPNFLNPPVVETILGVQFNPLKSWRNGHLGLFWHSLGQEDWPEASDAPPVEPVVENFGSSDWQFPQEVLLRFGPSVGARLQLRDASRDRMLQIQNGRLLYNWLGDGPDHKYPRYEQVKPGFLKAVGALREFLLTNELGRLRMTHWEVTYINHMPRDGLWQTPDDWRGIFPSLLPSATLDSPVSLEAFESHLHFRIPDQRARLHVSLFRGNRKHPAEQEQLVFNLVARGQLDDSTIDLADAEAEHSLVEGLDIGHEAIVRTFVQLTSASAHEFWRRER